MMMDKQKKKWIASLLEMLGVIVLTVAIFKFVVIPVRIDGISMENTLHDQSVAMINAIGAVSYTHLTLPTTERV